MATILVIEDEAAIRRVLVKILTEENKNSLDELRNWIKENPFDYEKLPEIIKSFIASGQAKKHLEILEYKDFIRKNF